MMGLWCLLIDGWLIRLITVIGWLGIAGLWVFEWLVMINGVISAWLVQWMLNIGQYTVAGDYLSTPIMVTDETIVAKGETW